MRCEPIRLLGCGCKWSARRPGQLRRSFASFEIALMLAVPAKIPELTYIFFCALGFSAAGSIVLTKGKE
jgi:hypothetical protein